MFKTFWLIVGIVFNPEVGKDGESSLSLPPLPTEKPLQNATGMLRSYDECKTYLYKMMEEGGEGWSISKTNFEYGSGLVLKVRNPPNILLQYTCQKFYIDMKILETIEPE